MRWFILFAALICSILSATAVLADAPSTPSEHASGQIRMLPPPSMPVPIMIVEIAPQSANSRPSRADLVSYALAPGEPVSVQSAATAVQEAAYSPNELYESVAQAGPLVRALAQARARFDATNGYSVMVSLCSSDAQGQPAPHDVLSLTIRAASGRVLFGTDVTTDENGCYTGNLALGRDVSELPAKVSDVSQEGVATDFPIAPPP